VTFYEFIIIRLLIFYLTTQGLRAIIAEGETLLKPIAAESETPQTSDLMSVRRLED